MKNQRRKFIQEKETISNDNHTDDNEDTDSDENLNNPNSIESYRKIKLNEYTSNNKNYKMNINFILNQDSIEWKEDPYVLTRIDHRKKINNRNYINNTTSHIHLNSSFQQF